MLFRFFSLYITLLLIVCPTSLCAEELDMSLKISIPKKIDDTSKEMIEKDMNDIFGEDPYLGQTSYLQSPESFSQRDKPN